LLLMLWPDCCHFIVTSAPLFCNKLNKPSIWLLDTIGSINPADKRTCLFDRSGRLSGLKGFIALNKMAPLIVSGFKRRRLAAIFAPLEKPIATVLFRSKE